MLIHVCGHTRVCIYVRVCAHISLSNGRAQHIGHILAMAQESWSTQLSFITV